MMSLERFLITLLAATVAALALAWVTIARAELPAGTVVDPAVHAWFESLHRADGMSCCGKSDCKIAMPGELRASAHGYQVIIDGVWTDVPDAYIVDREDNPFGVTVICRTRWTQSENGEYGGNHLYCVVPYSGG